MIYLKIKYYLLFLIGICFLGCNIQQKAYNASTSGNLYRSNVWKADNGDGTYTNPILYADYSDPDVIRVGNDFYMTASTFNFSPGLPILHSKDLINWHIINYALPQLPNSCYDDLPQYGKGVWAPCIRFHKGFFYIYWGDPDFGIYMVKSDNPAGKWSDPVLVHGDKGMIDPSPFWDNDGNAYLICAWAGSRSGINSILTLYKMSSDGTHLLDDGYNIYSGHGSNHTIEGPKLIRKNNYYYIFAPAGGVTQGWQVVLRSKNIYGPYEVKTVMARGKSDINGPHQGGYIETSSGQPWFLHFQDKGAYGRILHLNPVIWMNDWPVIGEDKDGDGCGEPVRTYVKPDVHSNWPVMNPQESDEFNEKKPGSQWEWAGNKKITWSISDPNRGLLRLLSVPKNDSIATLWRTPNLMLQRFPAPSFTATTKLCLFFEWNVWQG